MCLECNYKSNTYDSILDISLEIKNCNSMISALKHFTCIESLYGENKYYCPKYQKKCDAKK